MGSIPGWGTKIPQAVRPKKKSTDGQIKKIGDASLGHNDLLGKMNYENLFFMVGEKTNKPFKICI